MTAWSPRAVPAAPPKAAQPDLPLSVMTTDGEVYDVAGDVWHLPEDPGFAPLVKIDWTLLSGVIVMGTTTPVMSSRAVSLVKLFTIERLGAIKGALKPISAKDYLRGMLGFARWLGKHAERLPRGGPFDWGDLTAAMFDAWLTAEYLTKRKGDSTRLVRRFYSWGADEGYPDFSPALASVLEAKRIKGHAQGELVESRDKRRGAFTREELELIFNACKAGAERDRDRAMAWTLLETGIRPKQMYLLANRDLEVVKGGISPNDKLIPATFRLRVRKIKQRAKTSKYHFLAVSEKCARLLFSLRRPESGPGDPLFWWITSSYEAYMLCRLESFSRDAEIRSPRLPIEDPDPTGPSFELLHISPRRFRYGLATDRIARGESPEEVAESLGHSGTGHLTSYVETSPNIADEFQRATDYAIAPLIDLMEGRTSRTGGRLLADAVPTVAPKPEAYKDAPTFWFDARHSRSGYDERRKLITSLASRRASGLGTSEARIEKLIEAARLKFPLIYPGQDFDEQYWSIEHLKERVNAINKCRFDFSATASLSDNRTSGAPRPRDVFPACFANVIKSWIVMSDSVSLHTNIMRLFAVRHFWNFLSERRGGDIRGAVWENLSEEYILSFEQFLVAHRTRRGSPLSQESILSIIRQIISLTDFLFSYGICRRIDYIPQTPSPRRAASCSLVNRRLAAERKLPAPGVLETLAGIYYRITTAQEDAVSEVSEWMLIVISAVAILMLTGLRVGELVTLPFDCEVEDRLPGGAPDGPASHRYGIRYWVEKTGKKTMRIKWISPTAEPILRASIARIKRLTAAARSRAKILEADPTRVTLPPEIAGRGVITAAELLALIGQRGNGPVKIDRHKLLPQHGGRPKSYYYVADLEAYLLSKRRSYLYTIRHDDGTFQMLSESLFIIFAKQSRCRQMGACRLLVEPVTAHTIGFYLSSPHSLFKVYGAEEWQRALSANTRCFRHWLIHTAYKGRMETNLILRYFAKHQASGLDDYVHFSTGESEAYAPDGMSAARFYVPT